MADRASVIAKAQALLAEAQALPGPVVVTPTGPAPTINSRAVTLATSAIMGARMYSTSGNVLDIGFNDTPGQAYTRGQQAIELHGQTAANPSGIGTTNTLWMSTYLPALFPQCTVQFVLIPCNGGAAIPVGAPIAIGANTSKVAANIDISAIPEGWYWISVIGLPAPWSTLDYPAYVRHAAQAQPQTMMPVVSGSFTVSHDTGTNIVNGVATQWRYAQAMVPAQFSPQTVPLPHRDYSTPWPATVTSMQQFAYEMLVPLLASDVYRPNVLPSGVWTTHNRQNYNFSDYQAAEPPHLMLEGPRGVGALTMVLALRETARPGTGEGKCYGVEAWRGFSRADDGTILTTFGWVHDASAPPYTNNDMVFAAQRPAPPRYLVGDWSLCAGPKNPHELWDIATDSRTTGLDITAPKINGEFPHASYTLGGSTRAGVEQYATDLKNGRVLKIHHNPTFRRTPNDFTPTSLLKACVVTEFVTGLGDVWNCECVGNLLIVTDSTRNAINAYDMDTMDANGHGVLVWSVSFTRPEGLRVLGNVAYIGSFTSKAVWKMPLDTRVPVKLIDLGTLVDGNSHFVNVAVSETGIVATATWSNTQFGWPCVFDANGVRMKIGYSAFAGTVPKGTWVPSLLEYVSCVSLGNNRMTWGTMQHGLHRLSPVQATDTAVDPKVPLGAQQFIDRDLKLVYGDYGYGPYAVPPPFGITPEIDALLVNLGHTKP